MKKTVGIVAVAAAALATLRCSAGPPPQEIAQARLAIEDARHAGAERTATREFDAAVAHLNVAESSWSQHHDPAVAARWARVAEGEARNAQYVSEAQKAEDDLRRETDRKARGELAVRDAEIAVLQARARTEAERRAAEAEAAAAAERRRAQEELERRQQTARDAEQARAEMEARLASDQARAGEVAQEERDKLNAEIEKLRGELAQTQKSADEAKAAAEESARRMEEQRRAEEERQAEVARLRENQQQSEERLRQTLSELANVREEARGLIVTLPGNIYFDVNKSDVKPSMQERLQKIGQALATVPDRHVLIEGHTDSDGSASYNLRLSELRAQSVRSVLVSGGVDPAGIETHGYGVTRPIASNATPDGKAQNRRVEIVLQGAAPAVPPPPEPTPEPQPQ